VDTTKSDSANLDSALELLVKAGKGRPSCSPTCCLNHDMVVRPGPFPHRATRLRAGPLESLSALVPEAYTSMPDLDKRPELQAFYEYHAGVQVRVFTYLREEAGVLMGYRWGLVRCSGGVGWPGTPGVQRWPHGGGQARPQRAPTRQVAGGPGLIPCIGGGS
jgi:hypothetical protein